jgi:hypothetical protein
MKTKRMILTGLATAAFIMIFSFIGYSAKQVTREEGVSLSNGLPENETNVVRPEISVTPSERIIFENAEKLTFTVTSNTGWTVTSSQSWCTVTHTGEGNGTITAIIGRNNSASRRSVSVTVNAGGNASQRVTITQVGVRNSATGQGIGRNVPDSPAATDFDKFLSTCITPQGGC